MTPSPRLRFDGVPVKEDFSDRFNKAVQWLVQGHGMPHVQAESVVRVLWDRAFQAVDRERVDHNRVHEPLGHTTDEGGW